MENDLYRLSNHYAQLPTEELRNLSVAELTEGARRALAAELARRGDGAEERSLEELYRFVLGRLHGGVPGVEIERTLVAEGLAPHAARAIVSDVVDAGRLSARRSATRRIKSGTLWCGIGVVIIWVTYLAAPATSDFLYLVASVLIVFGGEECVRGLGQYVVSPLARGKVEMAGGAKATPDVMAEQCGYRRRRGACSLGRSHSDRCPGVVRRRT